MASTLFTIHSQFHAFLYHSSSSSTISNNFLSRPYKIPNYTPNPNSSISLRTVPKSSPPRSPTTPTQDQDTQIDPPPVNPDSSALHSFSIILKKLSQEFKIEGLGLEILSIALPAALALAADPITSLVDTAFVGHLGSVELAAVGVSVSVFNLVSKLFNVPLLNITTSFVAEEQSLVATKLNEYDQIDPDQSKIYLPSVSTSLALAAGLGIAEAVALFIGSGFLMTSMGIHVDSPMRVPAEQFLSLRAFGSPAIVIAQAAQGTFRGFKDTKTPLYAVGAGNLLNAILDPVLIFLVGLGIGGAAIATVISEYLIAIILLWKLNDKVILAFPNIDGRRVARYLNSGGLLIGRTIAVLVTMTLATSMAAREGPIPMAGHQICLEIWLTISLLTDALALAAQALLAGGYSRGDYAQSRDVVYKVLQIGSVTGVSLAAILFLEFKELCGLFTSDSEVLKIAWSGIL